MADPHKDKVVLLLPMEGAADGSVVFNDRTGKTVTVAGNTHLSTDVTPPWGKTSAYFDGTGDYLSLAANAAFSIFAGDCTAEFWFRAPDVTTNQCVLQISNGTDNPRVNISLLTGTVIVYRQTSASGIVLTSSAISVDTWYHVAFSLSGATSRLFLNGVLVASASSVAYTSTSPLLVTVGAGNSAANPFTGYIKDLRITKGVARYTWNFHVDNKPLDWNTPEQPRIII